MHDVTVNIWISVLYIRKVITQLSIMCGNIIKNIKIFSSSITLEKYTDKWRISTNIKALVYEN